MDNFINFFQSNKINIFDIIVAIIILFNLVSSLKKGFVLSLIYFLKWIIAFIIAKFSIPYVLPYVSKIIAIANPAAPALICTAVPPAKSSTPRAAKNPAPVTVSPTLLPKANTQCATGK